jgi:hypothetical protein
MRVRPLLAALTVLATSAVVVLPGVAPAAGPAQASYEPRFEPAPCPDLPEPLALPTARCGFLVVPENRSQPEGRRIRLAVAIVPAVSPQPAPDPIVHLTGGPGGIAIFEGRLLIEAGFNQNRDLILMNQRGRFLSEPALTCEVIDRFYRLQVGLPLDARSTRRKHVAATRECRKELVARGIDIAAYNTTEKRPTSLICDAPSATTGGTCSGSLTARTSRRRSCAITPRASAASSSTRRCR